MNTPLELILGKLILALCYESDLPITKVSPLLRALADSVDKTIAENPNCPCPLCSQERKRAAAQNN